MSGHRHPMFKAALGVGLAVLLLFILAGHTTAQTVTSITLISDDPDLQDLASITTDGTNLYVGGSSGGLARIWRIPIGGGAVARLYAAPPPPPMGGCCALSIAVIGDDLFMIDPNSGPITGTQILRAPKSGAGPVTPIYTATFVGQPILDGTGLTTDGLTLFTADEVQGRVHRVNADGSGLTLLGTRYGGLFDTEHQNTIAAGGGELFIADIGRADIGFPPQVVTLPKTGGAFTSLHVGSPLGCPRGITTGNGNVFVADPCANTVWSIPVTGGMPTAVVSGPPFVQITSVAFFNNALYVTDSDNFHLTSPPGKVYRVAVKQEQLTLTVNKNGIGGGMVISTPTGINCGNTCFAHYASGTLVVLTALADPGSTFEGWSGGGCAGTGTCAVTINDNTSVSATFSTTGTFSNGASLTALNTNQTTYQPGDLFILTLLLGTRPFEQARGDLYVQVTLPDGTVFFLDQTAKFTSAVRPFRPDLTIKEPSETEIFALRLPRELPEGTYTLQAFQVKTGSDPTNPVNFVGTGLPIRIAFIAPTFPVGTNATILTKSPPLFVDINPLTKTAVLVRFPNIVSTVNLETSKVISSIAVTASGIGNLETRNIVVNPITNTAVVEIIPSAGSCGVALIDLNTNSVTGFIGLPEGVPCFFDFPSSIAVDPQSNRAVVLNRRRGPSFPNFFTIIDLGTRKVVTSFAVQTGAIGPFSLNPGTNTIIAGTLSPPEIVLIDPDSGGITKHFPLDFSPAFISLLPGTIRLVVAGAGPIFISNPAAITILDLGTGQLLPPAVLPGIPLAFGLGINPVTMQAAVLGEILPFTRVNPGKVFIIDLTALKLLTSFDVPVDPRSLAFDSITGSILIPSLSAPALLVIQPQALPAAPQVGLFRVIVRSLDTDAPIGGATVTVKETGLATTTSDFKGEATFTAAPAGLRTVTVSAAGFAPAEVPVTIQAGQTNQVTIPLVRQASFGTLTGVVVSGVPPGTTGGVATAAESRSRPAAQTSSAQLGGTEPDALDQTPPACVPPNATPIPGATVALPSPGAPIEATTSANGTFFIAQAPAGTVLVAVRAPGQNPTTQLATIEQALENCIVVTLLPTLNPDAPTTTVTLNASSFHPGQTAALDRTLTLGPTASPSLADEYILAVFPDEQTVLSLVATPSGPPHAPVGVVPYRANILATPAADRIIDYTFSGGEAPGTYQVVGRLVKPGGNPLNPADWLSTQTARFTFGP